MAVTYERSWETKRGGGGRSVADESRDSYYGVPAIHRPHWRWLIVLYFFLGGLAGASYFVASLAHLFGGADRENERITRGGRYLSMAALIPCPLLRGEGARPSLTPCLPPGEEDRSLAPARRYFLAAVVAGSGRGLVPAQWPTSRIMPSGWRNFAS